MDLGLEAVYLTVTDVDVVVTSKTYPNGVPPVFFQIAVQIVIGLGKSTRSR